jgi:uncharacterized membrane protein YdjX (TVP38/TMEM64 family)
MNIRRFKPDLGFLILAFSLLLLWYLARFFHIDIQSIRSPLERFPLALSSIIYILAYVVVTFFVIFSKDIFYLSGALIFGPYLSALLIYISESLNACILFYLARYLGRGFVEKSLGAKHQKLDERLGNISLFWLFIFRAAPLIPYRFLDLAAGLTKMRFNKYLLAVVLGSPVKILWIQYVLAGVGEGVLKDPNALIEYFNKNPGLMVFSFIYLVLAGMVVYKLRKKY